MALPLLRLNLAPPPSLWRQHHQPTAWSVLALGLIALLTSLGLTYRAYRRAQQAGREAVNLTEEARRVAKQEQALQAVLQDVDVSREIPRWKLAERILQERSLPWSRLTAELEQCLVQDVRLKGLQRTRGSDQQVTLKLKGEAKSREAEVLLIDTLRSNPIFAQVILERETERQGGGWDFELRMPITPLPPPFQVRTLPKVAQPKASTTSLPIVKPTPSKPTPKKIAPPQASSPIKPQGVVPKPFTKPSISTPVPPLSEPMRPREPIQTRPLPESHRPNPTPDRSEPRPDREFRRDIL